MEAYRIFGGKIVTADRVIENGTIAVENGMIVDISPRPPERPGQRDIDAEGHWILPGIIDSHSDAIENEIQPRPRTLLDVQSAFVELERKLAAHGITTIYHALSVADNPVKRTVRNPDVFQRIIEVMNNRSLTLIRHRIHLRFEITHLDLIDFVEKLIAEQAIHQLSFTDHTPGQGQYRELGMYRQNLLSRNKLSDQEADAYIQGQMEREKADTQRLRAMAEMAVNRHIPIASHDDDSVEKLIWLSEVLATISEFPIELEVAKEAKRRGMHVVMGAPNLLLGRSTSGNLSALDAIRADVVDMLCSDYYPPSLLQAVFTLLHMGCDMPYAVNKVSLNPAKALGIDAYTGTLAPGKSADMLLVREHAGNPLLLRTIVRGQTVSMMNYRSTAIPSAIEATKR